MPKPILHTAIFHYPHHLSSMLASADGNLHMVGAHHGGNLLIKTYANLINARSWFLSQSLAKKMLMFSAVSLTPTLVFAALFLTPKTVNYSFAGSNCVSAPIIFPNFVTEKSSQGYDVVKTNSLSFAGYPVYSSSTCVNLAEKPDTNTEKQVQLSSLGLLNKNITVKLESLPELSLTQDLKQPISPTESLTFNLSKPDETFTYRLTIDDQQHGCPTNGLEVSCPLANFELSQGAVYKVEVKQVFNQTSNNVLSELITLRDPVVFESSSIQNEQKIYDKPDRIVITANKPIEKAENYSLKNGDTAIDTTLEISDNQVIILFTSELPRDSIFKLSIESATSTDGAYLENAYTLNFTTSGGPKVAGVNIGTYDVSPSKKIVLSFDTDISMSQNLSDFVVLSNANGTVSASISAYKNSVTISPIQSLDACSSFSIKVIDGIANTSGISGGSNWSINSRTTCKQVFSIGTSVQARELTAYRFGSGATNILFVGGIHGNERSSYRTLIAFVDELERRYSEIPTDKTVVIIPDINPDGYALQTRTNANGIDLNRNFPSNDWTTGVYMPGGMFLDNGGGATPLDQPESSALTSYINSFGPRLVLTYHAVARTVISNGANDSFSLATTYSGHSGYEHYTHSQEDGIFDYPTTGEFETWLADKKGIATLLIELGTMSSNELYSQRSAMWAMLGI